MSSSTNLAAPASAPAPLQPNPNLKLKEGLVFDVSREQILAFFKDCSRKTLGRDRSLRIKPSTPAKIAVICSWPDCKFLMSALKIDSSCANTAKGYVIIDRAIHHSGICIEQEEEEEEDENEEKDQDQDQEVDDSEPALKRARRDSPKPARLLLASDIPNRIATHIWVVPHPHLCATYKATESEENDAREQGFDSYKALVKASEWLESVGHLAKGIESKELLEQLDWAHKHYDYKISAIYLHMKAQPELMRWPSKREPILKMPGPGAAHIPVPPSSQAKDRVPSSSRA